MSAEPCSGNHSIAWRKILSRFHQCALSEPSLHPAMGVPYKSQQGHPAPRKARRAQEDEADRNVQRMFRVPK